MESTATSARAAAFQPYRTVRASISQFPGRGCNIHQQVHYFPFSKATSLAKNGIELECRAQPSNTRTASSVNFLEYTEGAKPANFFERLAQAWSVLFPSRAKPISNAEIAKQRLRMILISDRCAINDEAKRRIVDNVVGALSNFVEIEAEEKVQLNVSADPDLGTVYSVIVPVRRVKPEYQDYNDDIRNFDYGDSLGDMRTLDVRFEYPHEP